MARGQSQTQKDGRRQDNLSPQQRSKIGQKGGQARKAQGADYSQMGSMQGQHNNPANFANDPQKASDAGQLGGQKSRRGSQS